MKRTISLARLQVILFFITGIILAGACKKGSDPEPPPPPPPPPAPFSLNSATVAGINSAAAPVLVGIPRLPAVRLSFSSPVNKATVTPANLIFATEGGTPVTYSASYSNGDSVVLINPESQLISLEKYRISSGGGLRSTVDQPLTTAININFVTAIDSSRKFPAMTDEELLDKIQRQTFKYFWDFGHPTSGLARERSNGDDNTVTSGGSGFGIMAIITGIERGFISKAEGLARMQKIVGFLGTTATTVKGAYSHWLNGTSGAIQPFSAIDNGADLVETSYLIAGLLCARQYFSGAAAAESDLRNDINTIWQRVEWDWFRKGGEDVLYWHWSENYNWQMNLPIHGWNECLITYVLAASSPTHGVPPAVYHSGWTRDGAFVNNNTFYGYRLPLGPDQGGPLFLSHYSFLGINPNGLSDSYTGYLEQVRNHALINNAYCKANPRAYYGYSDSLWGLTASDIPNGYTASSPSNDVGVIAPTAAISSLPFTPAESMAAIRFFHDVLGDRLFKDYGFIDAFAPSQGWFAGSHLAIDQGPIIIMIENHRSGLLWDLFTSCPEIKTGMKDLGFTAPYL